MKSEYQRKMDEMKLVTTDSNQFSRNEKRDSKRWEGNETDGLRNLPLKRLATA